MFFTVLGPTFMKKYRLRSKKLGFHTVYNSNVDTTLNNGFAVAAFRFGHSQIPGKVDIITPAGDQRTERLETTFNRPSVVSKCNQP